MASGSTRTNDDIMSDSLGDDARCTFRSFWSGDSVSYRKETIDAFTFMPTTSLLVSTAALDTGDTVDEEQEPDGEDIATAFKSTLNKFSIRDQRGILDG